MRLWHWKLIPVLPRQQLLGQWRECNAIARNLKERGTPNHILVNPVCEYPAIEFRAYCTMIWEELQHRGYSVMENPFKDTDGVIFPIFDGWHDEQYLLQCYFNLQEKYDRGAIPYREWQKVRDFMRDETTSFEPSDIFDW